jgi:HNH endonuclease
MEEAVRNSRSYADVMRKLSIKCTGGNHGHIKSVITKYGINTSHFLGRRTNCGDTHKGGPARKSAQEILTLNNPGSLTYKVFQIRRALIEIGRDYCCVECDLLGFWNGKDLTLQVDHINGDKHDNRPENLRFLCPNCHSQTQNWGYRNQGGTSKTSRAAYARDYRKRSK